MPLSHVLSVDIAARDITLSVSERTDHCIGGARLTFRYVASASTL